MLKLTYTDNDLNLALLPESIENWLKTRVLLAIRTATPIFIDPQVASLVLRNDLPQWNQLETAINKVNESNIDLSYYDNHNCDIILRGTWVSFNPDPKNSGGIFVTELSYEIEYILYQIWLEANNKASIMID